jgi:hypothetical protein
MEGTKGQGPHPSDIDRPAFPCDVGLESRLSNTPEFDLRGHVTSQNRNSKSDSSTEARTSNIDPSTREKTYVRSMFFVIAYHPGLEGPY